MPITPHPSPLTPHQVSELDAYWMVEALRLAEKAMAQHEVPVGAVLVKGDQVVGQGWNQPIGANDPTAHAEILALRDAAERLGNYRLVDTTLYVTLEPCVMCAGAMIHARVGRIVYAAADPKTGAAGGAFDTLISECHNHKPRVEGGVLAQESGDLLRRFFNSRRPGQLTRG